MKNMAKNSAFLLVCIIFLPNLVSAMIINEIMYDVAGTDTGREWIEVHNNTNQDINFSEWKILENSVNHTVKLIKGSEVIPSGGYVIIADNDQNFLIDYPNFSGTLFDSVFSLTNTGEKLVLVNKNGEIVNEISYNDTLGAKGDGNSLQLNSEGFLISASPTPGEKNSNQSSPPISTTTSTISPSASATTTSTHFSPAPILTLKEEPIFKVSAGRDRFTSIKSPVFLKASLSEDFDSKGVKYLWSTGDGRQLKGDEIEYMYKHPGTYNVVLNAKYKDQQAVSRSKINVFKPELSIKSITDGLQILNLGKNEINIGFWKLKSEDKLINFTFPQDTIISAGVDVIFDKSLFGKSHVETDFSTKVFNLVFPNGDILTL